MTVYAFIDSQNLNLGIRSVGWQLDYAKFRHYLRQKYDVRRAYLFIGYRSANEPLYASLRRKGFILIFKPTLEQSDGTIKGNVDAELVLHAILEYQNYDKAILVSGDGDFHCLVEYWAARQKLLKIMVPNRHYSRLLSSFKPHVVRLDTARAQL